MPVWKCRNKALPWGEKTRVVAIVNVTPDSFSDGGRFLDAEKALNHARQLIAEGAHMLDIGGESTRPGAESVPAEREIERTLPLIQALRRESEIPITIDTSKAEVARAALEAGADGVNDVTAFTGDPAMAETVANFQAGVVLMHMQGSPRTMQKNPHYKDVVVEISQYLLERARAAEAAGIDRQCIALDPGIGFGKTLDHNLEILANLEPLAALGYPLYIGASRKSFIGHLQGEPEPKNRLEGSLAVAVAAALHGAQLLRVHDVAATCRALAVADAIKRAAREGRS